MTKRVKKTPSTYSAHVAELRKYATGFTAADGFDRRSPADWTPSQKRAVTKYAKAVRALTARPNIVFRARNEENLRRVQKEAGQHPAGVPRLKVAFVPYTPKAGEGRPEIRILKAGIVIAGEFWDRIPLMFNMMRLVVDPAEEIKRLAKHAPGAKTYTIQAGEFEITQAGNRDLLSLTSEVMKLMAQYDGVRPLPSGSGNRGDGSKHHHYGKWLHGIVAYKFHGRAQPAALLNAISAAKEKRRLMLDAQKSMVKRELRRAYDAGCADDELKLRQLIANKTVDGGRLREAWEKGRRDCARIDRLRR